MSKSFSVSPRLLAGGPRLNLKDPRVLVRCAFGRPKNPWTALRDALMRPDCRLRTALEDLKADAGIPKAVSPLRVLDVAVWMRHRPVHRGYRCAGLA